MRHARAIGSAVPLAAALLLSALSGAEAGDAAYCVTCKGPDQTYLCRVTGEEVNRSDAVKLYCVVRTAKEGGHASCGARDADAGCNGVEKTYSYNGPGIPEGLAGDPRVKKLMRSRGEGAEGLRQGGPQVACRGHWPGRERLAPRHTQYARLDRRPRRAGTKPGAEQPAAAGVASHEPLPELPGENAPAVPLSAAEPPSAPSAATIPAESAAPPERKSRVKSIARCVRSLFRRCGSDADAQSPN